MSMWTLTIALVCALIVWAILVRFLMAQPWLAAGDPGYTEDVGSFEQPPKKIGLYFLLAAISSLFALFITAYIMRMDPNHGADWYSIPKPGILWLNTLLLVYSSISMQHAKTVSLATRDNRFLRSLIIAGVFTLLFLGGQMWAWEQLHDSVYFHLGNPALGFFYLLTGIHALHLVGGLYVWLRVVYKSLRGKSRASISLSIDLCTTYWHYLLLVWLILFVLLLIT